MSDMGVAPTYTDGSGRPQRAQGVFGEIQIADDEILSVKAASYTPLGHQQILSATLASSTALTVPSGATTAVVQNNGTAAARFRYDGATTAPTATVGQRLSGGAVLTLDIGNAGLTETRFIYEASGAILDIAYFS